MPLRPDQSARIIAAINAKKGQHVAKCPVCGAQEFKIGNGFVSVPLLEKPTNLDSGTGRHYPMIALFCTNCGLMQFLNLRLLGLVDIAEGKDSPPTEEPGG